MLASLKTERIKLYRGPGFEPGSPALRAGTLPLNYPGHTPVHDLIYLL